MLLIAPMSFRTSGQPRSQDFLGVGKSDQLFGPSLRPDWRIASLYALTCVLWQARNCQGTDTLVVTVKGDMDIYCPCNHLATS